jgi:Cu(I)/Ag(I) efflux system membrane protein CusA/SilA
MAGLLPILWSTGTGAEVMQRIAVPMIGGMVSSTLLTLIVIPVVYGLIKGWALPRNAATAIGIESVPPVGLKASAQ